MHVTRINNQTNYKSFGMRPLKIEMPQIQAPVKQSAEQIADEFINRFSAEYGTDGIKALSRACKEMLTPKHTKIGVIVEELPKAPEPSRTWG